MRFIADTMLGTLARWLRVFGFDTAYAKGMHDNEIIKKANEESRTIISRDKELCGRVPGAILIEDKELEAQILAVLRRHAPDESCILTRCLDCNNLLNTIKKTQATGRVPESILDLHDEFWHCANCNKAFWKGSHYRKMLDEVGRLLSQRDS